MIPADQLSREMIEGMKEAELRERVLIPLFTAMGFIDVKHYHGGAGEKGKDIIMARPDALGVLEYYAVVVLAERISGKAEGSRSTASKVFFQIRQSLSSRFVAPRSMDERRADRCWVVTSREAKKEALESLVAALGDDRRLVRVIDGDELWSLVEIHLKQNLIASKLQSLHSALAAAGHGLIVKVESKSGIDVNPVFDFPNTPEGESAKAAYDEHLKSGAPVLIPAEYLSDIAIWSDLRPLITAFPGGVVALGPSTTGVTIACDVALEAPDGRIVTLRGLQLGLDYRGSESFTFSNRNQSVPWNVVVVGSTHSNAANLSIGFRLEGANVKQQFEALEFQRGLSSGGYITFTNLENGTTLLNGPIPPHSYPAPREEVMLVSRSLYKIQQRTGCLFTMPSEISQESLDAILTVAQIVETGELRYPGDVVLTVPASRMLVEGMIGLGPDPNRHMFFAGIEEKTWEVLGINIPLGRILMRFVGGAVQSDDIERLRSELADPSHDDLYELRYQIPPESEVIFNYERYLPEEKRVYLKIFQASVE